MHATPVRLVLVESYEEMLPHLSAWQSLSAEAAIGDWFASPLWQVPFMQHFSKTHAWRLILGFRENELVGAMPFVVATDAPWGRGQWQQPVNIQVRRVGAICREGEGDFLLQALQLAVRRSPNRCVELGRLACGEAFDRAVLEAIRISDWRSYDIDEPSSAVADLSRGWDAYVATRDSKVVRNLRSRRRKLDADSAWTFHRVQESNDFLTFWDAVMAIEATSWKHGAHSALSNEPAVAEFYRDVLQGAAEARCLVAHVLAYDGEPVAYTASVSINGCNYLLKNSYRESFRSWSPGISLVWHSMEECARAGVARYDFLGDMLPWKQDLATQATSYVTRTIFPFHHIMAQARRFIEHGVKPVARRSRLIRAWRQRRKSP